MTSPLVNAGGAKWSPARQCWARRARMSAGEIDRWRGARSAAASRVACGRDAGWSADTRISIRVISQQPRATRWFARGCESDNAGARQTTSHGLSNVARTMRPRAGWRSCRNRRGKRARALRPRSHSLSPGSWCPSARRRIPCARRATGCRRPMRYRNRRPWLSPRARTA